MLGSRFYSLVYGGDSLRRRTICFAIGSKTKNTTSTEMIVFKHDVLNDDGVYLLPLNP